MKIVWLLTLMVICVADTWKIRPVLYIIGDSTVRNGNGSEFNVQQGWGSLISPLFDTTKISIQNQAIGGRSSRTFLTEGRWEKIKAKLKHGDFVMMQFGHNDAGPLDDTARARGTLKGIGNDSVVIYNPIRKQDEVVYTYGYYISVYVTETKRIGAVPIVCSPVPRNNWKDGKVVRVDSTYGLWSKQVADAHSAFFIDLNSLIAAQYEKLDTSDVNSLFSQDHTHTNRAGAYLNASFVVSGIATLNNCALKKYLKKK